MKHLFVARYGDHSSVGGVCRLNDSGCQQMEKLGKCIKDILDTGSVEIVSSTAPHALDSSKVLAAQWDLPELEQIPYLWSGSNSPNGDSRWAPDGGKLIELINERKNDADGLVIMTHLEVARDFSNYYLEQELEIDACIGKVPTGRAVHIDLEKNTYQIFPI